MQRASMGHGPRSPSTTPLRLHNDVSLLVERQGHLPRPVLWRPRRCVGTFDTAAPCLGPRLHAQASPVWFEFIESAASLVGSLPAPLTRSASPTVATAAAGEASWRDIKCLPCLHVRGRPEPRLVRVHRKYGFPRGVAARASDKERESHRRATAATKPRSSGKARRRASPPPTHTPGPAALPAGNLGKRVCAVAGAPIHARAQDQGEGG